MQSILLLSVLLALIMRLSMENKGAVMGRTGVSGIRLLIPGMGSEPRWGGTVSEQLVTRHSRAGVC